MYLVLLVFSFATFVPAVVGDCECGYQVNLISEPTGSNRALFTELLESDFTTLKNISQDTDWVVQEWTVDAKASRGPYGRALSRQNVLSDPKSKGESDGFPGLQLFVRPVKPSEKEVPCSEIDSARDDMLYGSFRAGLKLTGVEGTCGAFFWYFNDTQEIDMEFLSSRMKADSTPLNLVIHSPDSFKSGGDAADTPLYKVIEMPFRADGNFHDYRFDWTPKKVSYYVDGVWVAEMVFGNYIPSVPGKLMLSHWSNGNSLWSEGPPKQDAAMTVAYVKAYFNSSTQARANDYSARCSNPSAPNAVCTVPDQTVAPMVYAPITNPARPYFFYQDPGKNKTFNQTVYGELESGIRKKSAASMLHAGHNSFSLLLTVGLVMIFFYY